MKNELFNMIVEKRFKHCQEIFLPKNNEYSRNDDRLHNFKRAGQLMGTTPEKALLCMMLKHAVSILDIVDDAEKDILPKETTMKEKFSDIHNYLYLLEGLIEERRQAPREVIG